MKDNVNFKNFAEKTKKINRIESRKSRKSFNFNQAQSEKNISQRIALITPRKKE